MSRTALKIGLLFALLLAVVVALFVFDLQQYATLEYLKLQKDAVINYTNQYLLFVLLIYALVYIATAALSLPFAAVITLLGGVLFGFFTGLVVVSFASTIGATLAFLSARFIARDYVQRKYRAQLAKINEEFNRDGVFYLFALRLVPVFPFFLVNILMALLPIKTWRFYWVSQLGMLPGTAVYVYAGTQLATIDTLADVVSPGVIVAFVLLGLFPLITKKVMAYLKTRKSNQPV